VNYYQQRATPLERQRQQNRRDMLTKVKAIWIRGLLEHSLAEVVRIDLEMEDRPDAVDRALSLQYQDLRLQMRSITIGTPIIDVFAYLGGELLILGAPGAGKTTTLLELARDLIARAEQDQDHPIPVVYNLSSWAEYGGSFGLVLCSALPCACSWGWCRS
jgi:flagellar biosynthesis GTPase FlhF